MWQFLCKTKGNWYTFKGTKNVTSVSVPTKKDLLLKEIIWYFLLQYGTFQKVVNGQESKQEGIKLSPL